MDKLREDHEWSQSQSQHDTQQTNISLEMPMRTETAADEEVRPSVTRMPEAHTGPDASRPPREATDDSQCTPGSNLEQADPTVLGKRDFTEYEADVDGEVDYQDVTRDSQDSQVSDMALEVRLTAFQTMLANIRDGGWQEIDLLSTCEEDRDLGSR
jgi:hypothetical protein